MRRAVITGIGIVSCIGTDKATVTESLRTGRSGIRFNPSYAEAGLRSQVSGSVDINLEELIDRKVLRFMGDAAAFAYLSMQQAIEDSGLTEEQVSNPRTGLIAGSGGASTQNQMEAIDTLREKGVKRVGPYRFRLSGHSLQNQGRELLCFLCMRHQCPLYWSGGRANSAGQTGRGLCRWR